MSIRAQAFADFKSIIDADGDDVTLVAPDATEYAMKGQVTRRDAQKDPSTDVQITAPLLAVTVPLSGLAAIPTAYEWSVRTTDATGAALDYQVAEVRVDRTIGMVTLMMEDYDG
ncbi:MAG: hypothetical protein ACOCZB_05945 [Spirochaetota bacterium]